ncbi:hypothetical protein C8R43DRAFT_150689 [Mycena crocata]|nr:hypothetical protein C8R43DRAFT_150689 [Mycena crocata]
MIRPIEKLPVQLLTETFKIAIRLEDDEPSPHLADSQPLPVLLRISQVCRGWRQLVESTPRLWTELVTEFDLDKRNMTDEYLQGVETFFARSSPCPISVFLDQTVPECPDALSRAVTFSANRWKDLELAMCSFECLANLPPGSFEILESLRIEYTGDTETDVVAFSSSPNLRNLFLTVLDPEDTYIFDMPWSQLTCLSLGDPSLDTCFSILLQCTSLISATFVTTPFDFKATKYADSLLPCLRRLRMTFDWGDVAISHIEPFFIPIALPGLKILDLTFDPAQDWSAEEFAKLQERSPNITKIRLDSCAIDPEGLITLLRHGHALNTLKIGLNGKCLTNDVLRALQYNEADLAPLAPKLRYMHFKSVGYDTFDETELEDMIETRWWTDEQLSAGSQRVARLKEVFISAYDDHRRFHRKGAVVQKTGKSHDKLW